MQALIISFGSSSHSQLTMNNYMKRLVTAKKKSSNDASSKQKEVKATKPPPEAALPVGTRSKNSRRRINPLVRSSENTAEATTPASPTRKAIFTTATATTAATATATNNNANSDAPSKASWLALAKSDSVNDSDDDAGDELFEDPANATMMQQVESFESPTKGSNPWDEPRDPSGSNMSKETVEKELADVRMDRDMLRQQLLEARSELEIALSTLRENVSDLEVQLRVSQQSERRQSELEENALLEEEIDELARLAREEEETNAAAELAAATAAAADGITISTEGAVAFPIDDPVGSSSPASHSNIHVEDQSTEERMAELEDALNERKVREERLEKEVRQLKDQAQVESQKFEESQRQVQWFQQELQAIFPQGSETSSQGDATEGNRNWKNLDEDNADCLETIMESNPDNKDRDEHNGGKSVEEVCDSDSDSANVESLNFDVIDPGIHVISASVNDETVPSSSSINFLPPDSSMHVSTKTAPSSSGLNDVLPPDYPMHNSSNHVKLLHEQRLELEQRVQELLDDVGTLQLGQRTYEHELQQSDTQVLRLQTELQQQQEEYRLELVIVERQLTEWKGRSDSFQMNFDEERNLAEQQNARSQLGRQERHALSQRVEELELQKNKLEDRLEKGHIGFEHEKGYLKRAMKVLEKKVQDISVDSISDISNSNNDDTTPMAGDSSRQTHAIVPKPPISDHDVSRDEARKGLLDRIQELEADRKARIESERALQEQLKTMTEQEGEIKSQAAAAEDRVRVLQTCLDASFSASPKRERQRELKQEYLSVHSPTRGEDQNNQEEFHETVSESTKTTDIAINSDSTKSIENVEDGTFSDVHKKTNKLSTDPGQRFSPESRARTLKLSGIEEQSIKSDVLVHKLHLKLEDEMENLKKRKERRRTRGLSLEPSPSDRGVSKYRSLLDSTADILHLDSKTSDPKAEKALAAVSTPQTEVASTSKEQFPTDYQSNSEQVRISSEQDCGNNRKEEVEMKLKETSKAEDEYTRKIKEENSRLETALETVNYSKTQLEIQLEGTMQQATGFIDQVDTLNAEIKECRCSLDQSEKGKSELMEQIDILRNETSILKNNIAENEKDKKLYEATLSKLKEDLDAKDKMVIEEDESYRIKFEETKKALDESHEPREDDHTSADQINHLEAKILLIETESKANVELLSNKLGSVVNERDALELKFQDASKKLDDFKQNESSLKIALQENIVKFDSTQDEVQKLSQTKERENAELGKTIFEQNERIVDLESDLSRKGKRLEQASLQLSEFENELVERDDEIQKLDAKRYQIQDNASQQLVDMEKFLEQEGKEIDRLEDEKSKLQVSVQKYEDHIEKQVGRIAEASLQLSELEREAFEKDDEIEEMELRINAMHALDAQRLEILQDSETQKKSLEEQLESANQTIQSLTSQVEKIKQEREAEKTEAQFLLIEDGRKDKEILSRQNQLNRQLQNVSKLTEQTDKWQLQLEKVYDEKQELLDSLSDVKTEVTSLREEREESNEKINELNATNTRLKDDLVCVTEEDEKNRLRISQIEEQKEALSQKLESAVDNLADLEKQFGRLAKTEHESREIDERLNTDIVDKLQENLESAQAVDEETEIYIKKLTEQVELERRSFLTSELQRGDLENKNEALTFQICALVKISSEDSEVDATTD